LSRGGGAGSLAELAGHRRHDEAHDQDPRGIHT
jgi:hypothetical protein